ATEQTPPGRLGATEGTPPPRRPCRAGLASSRMRKPVREATDPRLERAGPQPPPRRSTRTRPLRSPAVRSPGAGDPLLTPPERPWRLSRSPTRARAASRPSPTSVTARSPTAATPTPREVAAHTRTLAPPAEGT